MSAAEKAGYKPYDTICRVCKEREHNHTKWICTECATEALKWFYGDKGLPEVREKDVEKSKLETRVEELEARLGEIWERMKQVEAVMSTAFRLTVEGK